MILLCPTIHQNVIKINYYKFIKVRPNYLIHDLPKCAWGVRKPEWHDHPFEESLFYFESHLLFTFELYSNMMVTSLQIYLRQNSCATKLVQHIIQPRNGKPILNCDLVNGPAVNTHSSNPILLRHQQSRHCTGTNAFSNITFL